MTDHEGHDIWPLISQPGVVWCRTCKFHWKPTARWLEEWRAGGHREETRP
jgi:hypothetical protein